MQLMRSLNALLACVLGLAGWAAQAAVLPASGCPAPKYTPEMTRYALEGKVRLSLLRRDDGAPLQIKLEQSSGWDVLDEAALKQAKLCHFAVPAAEELGKGDTLELAWTLPGPAAAAAAASAPSMTLNSCSSKTVFRLAAPEAESAYRVRLMVWSDGQIYQPKLGRSTGEADLDQAILDWVSSCKFTPAQGEAGPVPGAAAVRLDVRSELVNETALRALYQRLLPVLERRAYYGKEYKLAHIMKGTEAEASVARAYVVKGTPFAELARKSIDPGSKDTGGELGWVRPQSFATNFADALRNVTAPGLVDGVLKSQYGWHVVRVDGIRPQTVPSFEAMQAVMKSVIARSRVAEYERLLQVQAEEAFKAPPAPNYP
ncbi:MAG: peptidylprolyl isomerase [Massilia sp.]